MPLVPPAAFRPLGTLHLTIGVMSLKEPGRLEGALKLLQELDLAGILRGVSNVKLGLEERVSEKSSAIIEEEKSTKAFTEVEADTGNASMPEAKQGQAAIIPSESEPTTENPPLSTLQTLPLENPTNATVLHTPPLDPTSRLLPFCHHLLAHFRAAGFIQPNFKSAPRAPSGECNDEQERDPTLHATLLKTVYAQPKRPPSQIGEKRRRGRAGFDASPLLQIFNEEEGAGNASFSFPSSSLPPLTAEGEKGYTFASAIAIDRVQICEMGAKKVDPENDPDGLGERYVVVGEKVI
jgi:activating signal cointegrator complex subunit 1